MREGISQMKFSLIGVLICSLVPVHAHAVSFLTFDPRSMAMGGAVIAIARPYNASLYNPALVLPTDRETDWHYFTRPYVGARLIDRDNFLDALDHYIDNNAEQVFDERLAAAKAHYKAGTLNSTLLRNTADAARQWQQDVSQLSNKPLRISKSEGLSLSLNGEGNAWGGHFRNYFVLGSTIDIAPIDLTRISQAVDLIGLIADIVDQTKGTRDLAQALDLGHLEDLIIEAVDTQQVSEELESYYDLPSVQAFVESSLELGRLLQSLDAYLDLDGFVTQLQDPNSLEEFPDLSDYLRYQIPESFESTVSVQGADIDETSISYAFRVFGSPKLQLGVNIKHLRITTIDLSKPIGEFQMNDYKAPEHQLEHHAFNADLGVFYQYNHALSLGAVIKNILPDDYRTVRGNPIQYRPLLRIGASYVHSSFRFAADLDLTKNDPLGFDPNKQYLSLGVEYLIWQNTALRVGARTNLVTGTSVPSLGLGVGSYSAHLDLAVTQSDTNDELGAALQLGFRF